MYIWNIIENDRYHEIRVEIRSCTLHQLCELADRIDLGMGSVDVLRFFGSTGRLYIRLNEQLYNVDRKEIRNELQKMINLIELDV